MRLLRVIRTLNPETGGPIEGVRQTSRILQSLGHQVEVFSFDPPDNPWGESFPAPAHCAGRTPDGYGWHPPAIEALAALVPRFDATILSGLWQFPGVAVRRIFRRRPFPYLVFPHGMLDPWFNKTYPFKRLKKQMYWWLQEGALLRDAKAVLFTSEQERLLARQSFRPYHVRERVVNYGVSGPPAALDHAAARSAFLDRCPELNGGSFILFLGRIHPKKGLVPLIDGFAGWVAGAPAGKVPQLVVAGPCPDPDYLAKLKALCETRGIGRLVCWPGMLSGGLKWGAFAAAEAFVLPSHQENFGIAVAEALASGLPVLISDQVNIWREIKEGGAGLVASDTREGVMELLRGWAALGPPGQDRMRLATRDLFARKFEAARAAQSLLDAAEEAMEP